MSLITRKCIAFYRMEIWGVMAGLVLDQYCKIQGKKLFTITSSFNQLELNSVHEEMGEFEESLGQFYWVEKYYTFVIWKTTTRQIILKKIKGIFK